MLKMYYKKVVSEFAFDGVLDTPASQEDSYKTAAQPVIDKFIQGYNGLILAYGETGSGKTHTMLGDGILIRKVEGEGDNTQSNRNCISANIIAE